MNQMMKPLLTYSRLRQITGDLIRASVAVRGQQRLLSSMSNKRITRLRSELSVSETELKSSGNESLLKTRLVNRNPRNLEQMLFEYKPLGYELDVPDRTYWNKIVFDTSGKHLTASIVHNSGRIIVSASTKEAAIGQQLKSSRGVAAATSLGQVLAMRALESGVLQVFVGVEYESDQSLKAKAFLTALKDNGLVRTAVGTFVGHLTAYGGKDVTQFLGIPYAEPPIGSLRFKRPVPYRTSNQLKANRWPNPCLQRDNHLQLNNYNFSEDCLYLNIWSPRVQLWPNVTHKPVVVLIHTGAFMFGSASEATYNGVVLSALGDVIVVTFNYRLNVYGFLYTGTESVTANAGMYDQMLAIQWVAQHIRNFGGDPNRVTLVGQSTGALSVGFHILSPISNKLFSRAVLISGSPLEHRWLSEPEMAKQFWINYAKDVNCMTGREESMNSIALKCLQKVNRNRLPAMSDIKRYSMDPFIVSAPVVFDSHFNTKLNETLKTLNSNISILFGYTDDEGSWMLSLQDNQRFGPQSQQNMTFNDTVSKLNEFLLKIKSNTEFEINVISTTTDRHVFEGIVSSVSNGLINEWINYFSDYFLLRTTKRFLDINLMKGNNEYCG
ncbi:unnamed protein product [Medioppia subpectinata]|uniref:Carboxylic ester hydrolase n=1 Tax=Medioppia subpectinata TaxID=1979941 RepID=A0A7R9L1R9_9ACAR|nr:unnamed protein product [Medioppia subpectinata]CAG2113750.1 unnamed protein product [Medioppia subpectinata]